MSPTTPHICVCICTYKRPLFLRRLLEELKGQQTQGLFTFSIVVADNDQSESAKQVVEDFIAAAPIRAIYCVEPRQNIALARNKAIENAEGEFVAFIDDDEFPTADWLWNLFTACSASHVAGVLGPVRPHFTNPPPEWILNGRLAERPTYETGRVMDWRQSRTGNVLFKKEILDGCSEAFRPQFGTGGEDVDFFERMTKSGFVFIWCNEANVFEEVPQSRCTRMYYIRRALLRGRNTWQREDRRVFSIGKSLIALPVYGCALPILFVFGHHHFMKYLIKWCDHAGKLLALIGMSPVKVRES
ncbi:MAG: glycosyltransferase family 2 protein [Nitrospirales bacterium]